MLVDVLRCPGCERGSLRAERAGYICSQCSAGFPVIGGAAWLFRDPRGAAGEGRGRLTLIANEVARLALTILQEYASAQRKIKDTKNAPEATQDAARQLKILMPRDFIAQAPWAQLQHFARYLKAITVRLDKYRADPARDAARMKELQPLEQRYWRLVAERKGQQDARMQEFRWMLEELRVGLYAQELKTPMPVSVKRLQKIWESRPR